MEKKYDQTLYDLSKEIELKAIEMLIDMQDVLESFTKMSKFFHGQTLSMKKNKSFKALSLKRNRRKDCELDDKGIFDVKEDNNAYEEEEKENNEEGVKEDKIFQQSKKNQQQIQHESQFQFVPQQQVYQLKQTLPEHRRKRSEKAKLTGTILEMVGVRKYTQNKRFKVIMLINDIEVELGPFPSRSLADKMRSRLKFQLKASKLRNDSTKEEILNIFNNIKDEIYEQHPPFKVSKRGLRSARKSTHNCYDQYDNILGYPEEESEHQDKEDEKNDNENKYGKKEEFGCGYEDDNKEG